MKKPQRLQLSRTKGFNLQALSIATNGLRAVNCARPSKWGNPFKMAGAEEMFARRAAVDAYRRLFTQPPSRLRHLILRITKGNNGRGEYRVSIMKRSLPDLRGKNLACWCSLDMACHCDVLLELANALVCEAA